MSASRRARAIAAWLASLVGLACAESPTPVAGPKPLLIALPAAHADPPASARAEPEPPLDPIKVGIIHSLSGTLAEAETPLKNVALMAIDELNQAGGVLGHPLEPVVVDPASNWPLFAQKARELLERQKARVLFGGYTSVARKSMEPTIEELHGLLFYPTEYEGERPSPNVICSGSLPNQSLSVVVDYLRQSSPKVGRFIFIGTDYVQSRVLAKRLDHDLVSHRVKPDQLMTLFVPFGHERFEDIVKRMLQFARGERTVVLASLWSDSAIELQRELAQQHVSRQSLLPVSFGIGERLVAQHADLFRGSWLASSYFDALDNPTNVALRKRWAAYVHDQGLPADQSTLSDAMEATYLDVKLWKQGVEAAGSFDAAAVVPALAGQIIDGASGFKLKVDSSNHHLHKPYFIGEVQADGRLQIVFKTEGPMAPDADSAY